ncbi:tetratricopeptide repeat protein 39B-like protein, partial [Dinothrombium tinctorium]
MMMMSAKETDLTLNSAVKEGFIRKVDNGFGNRVDREANKIFDLFYANKFDEVYARCDEKINSSLMHSHAKTFISFLYALLTLESNEIARGKEAIEQTLQFCEKKRKSKSFMQSVSSFVWKNDVDKYTDSEVHAELVYAECQIMIGLLTFFGDQNIVSLIKAALKITSSNQNFKFCQTILNERTIWQSPEVKMHFESGVCNGIGIFNLVVSMMPKKILKLLTFVGFSGDKNLALEMIKRSTEIKEGLRSRVSAMSIQGFALYFEQLMGLCEIDSKWIDEITYDLKSRFPNGVFVLFFSGKHYLLKGEPDKAINEFTECIALQDSWKQIHNICNWDLVWCYALKNDWENAAKHAMILREECAYSPATNEYQFAVFKMMQMEYEKRSDLKNVIKDSIKSVVKLKKRYAGKTIPQEKFICTRAAQYAENEREPLVVLMELFYVWNVFAMTSDSKSLIDPLLQKIDNKLIELRSKKTINDEIALLTLVKGVLLRNLGAYDAAENCFKFMIEMEDDIQRDTYIVPHSSLELGITHLKAGKYDQAEECLEKTKSGYEKFLNESV